MKNVKIPEGYAQVIPYLIVKGAGDFIQFMQQVFDAVEIMRHMRDENVIMHAELKIGDCFIMLADSTSVYTQQTGAMFIYVDDADARYTKALEAGATAINEPVDQSYGRSGGVTDPYGNVWWITSMK